jgi:hypothetical protein
MSANMVDKDHIDFLVQSAIVGATDSRGWAGPEDGFSYYFHRRHARVRIDPLADSPRSPRRGVEIVPPWIMGERLAQCNLDSIHARYPDTVGAPERTPGPIERYWEQPYTFEPINTGSTVYSLAAGLTEAVQAVADTATVATALAHYEYQACEHEGWRESEGFYFCEAMRCRLLAKLPGAKGGARGYKRAERIGG